MSEHDQPGTAAEKQDQGDEDKKEEEEEEVLHADLGRFLQRCREYESTVPEEVCRYYMREGGVDIREDENQEIILKLVALATDQFLARVVQDAADFSALRARADGCLRIQDLMLALQRRGVTTLHPSSEAIQAELTAASAGGGSRKHHIRSGSTGSTQRGQTPPPTGAGPGFAAGVGKRPRSTLDNQDSASDLDHPPHKRHLPSS